MSVIEKDDVLEDLEFLNDTGVGAVEAAKRLGFATPHALEKWLYRHERADLWASMKRRDPDGIHHERRKERPMSIAPQPTADSIASLLSRAKASTKARTRSRAARIEQMIDDLRNDYTAELQQIDAEREARKEIERLERKLAEAKAKLRGGKVRIDVGDSVSAADLRAWATANGVDCPSRGRVPAEVAAAYAAAQQGGAA